MRIGYLLWLLFIPGWLSAQRYELVLHEIFADPSPPAGLPNSEWIELRNRSNAPVSLLGWRLSDGTGQSAPFPDLVLAPDSLLIVCSPSALVSLNGYGRCLGIPGFPSLDNDGELLVLRNAAGQIIHAIDYAVNWHSNELKKAGGWSLEMIDADHPGSFQLNWGSATHPAGGTPGKPNSIAQRWEDRDPPHIMNGYALDSLRLLLLFEEALDSTAVATSALLELAEGRAVTDARCLPPLYDRIEIRTDGPLQKEKIYTLGCRKIPDLAGNQFPSKQSIRIGLPSDPDMADMRINEILFDPPTGGSDYAELLNISKKIIDLSRIYLTTRGATGNLGTAKQIRSSPKYFFPEDHLVLTPDIKGLQRYYFVQEPELVVETAALPSLPDAAGNLVVLTAQGKVIDELSYSTDWHYPLLRTKAGVALERIDPKGKTQDRNNWQSAAGTVGYGTPTRRNSQYRLFTSTKTIELSSTILSPDGDGRDDLVLVRFKSAEPANRLRIRIFHGSGVVVRELANGTLAGTEAVFNWDGLDEKGRRLPTGNYILLAEINDPNGKQVREKRTVAVVNAN